MDDVSLGNQIGAKVLEAYQELASSCKPGIRSNGVLEWTVLAGIVAIDKNSGSLKLISIATGVKALPDAFLHRSDGKMVHDCHAEILALRAFNAVILDHISYMKSHPNSENGLLDRTSKSEVYHFKDNWELAIYISALPCGDASMDLLCQDDALNEMQKDDSIQYLNPQVTTIVRGRFNYFKRQVVRTKPGRFDSPVTFSKSCSDKLCQRQVTSILNSMTWSLMDGPVYLKYLVTSPVTDYLKICFQDRVRHLPNVPLKCLPCFHQFEHDRHSHKEEPSSMSSVKLFLSNGGTVEQAILNGLKNGFYTKGNKPLRRNCEPIVSRYAQWQLFKTLKPEFTQYRYLQFKSTLRDRKKLIETCRQQLSSEGWIATRKDDCQ